MVYSFGRDKWFRPSVIMDVSQMVTNLQQGLAEDMIIASYFMYSLIKQVCFVPGKVE